MLVLWCGEFLPRLWEDTSLFVLNRLWFLRVQPKQPLDLPKLPLSWSLLDLQGIQWCKTYKAFFCLRYPCPAKQLCFFFLHRTEKWRGLNNCVFSFYIELKSDEGWTKLNYAEEFDTSLESVRDNVPRLDCNKISKSEFVERYEKQRIPVVLTHAMDHWKGMRKWTVEVWSTKLHSTLSVATTGDKIVETLS